MATFSVVAQSRKVVTAFKYLQDFKTNNDPESLVKAKEAIDTASANADTKDQAKTQFYRGQIYLSIFDNNLRTQTEKLTTISDPNKKTLAGYLNTPSVELEVAYEAYVKAKSLDEKKNFKADIENGIARIGVHFTNKAIADYNAKNYANALPSFEKSYEINGAKDTTTLGNCALVAERAGAYEKAKSYYQKMIDTKQGLGSTYSSLVSVYFMMKDTAGGIDILKKGRAAYPNDIGLLISETNNFLKNNKSSEALTNLNQAIQAKPSDANLYLVRGNIYDNLANPKDNTGNDLSKPIDYDEKIKMAEADYKKAIELKPDYFDALYNLGVLYNNHGVVFSKQADKITDLAKYKAENEKATAEFSRAMPVLEKALEVNPKDRNTMIALKQIYARMQLLDKLKVINEKLKH